MPSSAPAHVSVLVGWAEFVWLLEIPLKFAGCRLFVFSSLSLCLAELARLVLVRQKIADSSQFLPSTG